MLHSTHVVYLKGDKLYDQEVNFADHLKETKQGEINDLA